MAVATIFQVIERTVFLLLLAAVAGAIHRLYFHPLAHIPGPKLAALTWWYEFYFDVIQPGKYVFHIQELHKRYGPIIRITPDKLHVNDVEFIDTLKTLRVPGEVGATARYDIYKRRREALGSFFSKRNMVYLEPVIMQKVEQLCQVIEKHAVEKTPVNLSDVFFAFSNDVVTNFLFAHQTDLLADETKAATLRHNSQELLLGVHVNKHLSWIPDILESLPLSISKPLMPPGLIDMLDLFEKVRAELLAIMKAKSAGAVGEKRTGTTGKESVYDSVLDSSVLPPVEKSLLRLEQEGTLLVLAGTESPAKTLIILFFHIFNNPLIVRKLRSELDTVPISASWSQLEKLPYLSAVIEEANRLSFGVTARLARIAHYPITYNPSSYISTSTSKSYTIPAGTPVSITTLSAHTNETIFPDPLVFDPERWLGIKGRERRRFQLAFNKGGRKCLGIELAGAELYLMTTALVRRFDMTLWQTDKTDVGFYHDYQVAMPKLDSKGVRVTATAL